MGVFSASEHIFNETAMQAGTKVGMATNGTMAGVFMNGMIDWSSVGWHEGWEQMYGTSASSFVSRMFGCQCHQWLGAV